MTLNGAIMELVMLSEHPMMPVIFKPSIQKIIETVSECEEPERPTGRWIIIKKGEKGYSAGSFRCSVCGEPDRCWVVPTNYCPNCGAKMGGQDDV